MESTFRQNLFIPTLFLTTAFVIFCVGAGVSLIAFRHNVELGEILFWFGMAIFWSGAMILNIYVGADIIVDKQSIGRSVFSLTIIRAPWRSVTVIRVFQVSSGRKNSRAITYDVHFTKNGRERRIVFGNKISNYSKLSEILACCVRDNSIPVEGDCRDELLINGQVYPTP